MSHQENIQRVDAPPQTLGTLLPCTVLSWNVISSAGIAIVGEVSSDAGCQAVPMLCHPSGWNLSDITVSAGRVAQPRSDGATRWCPVCSGCLVESLQGTACWMLDQSSIPLVCGPFRQFFTCLSCDAYPIRKFSSTG